MEVEKRNTPVTMTAPAEQMVKGIRRATRKLHSSEENLRIEQVGTPMDLYEHPVDRFDAGFIGAPATNFLPVRSDGHLVASPGLRAVSLPDGKEAVAELGVRPEDLRIATGPDGDLVGQVELIERLGAETYAYVHVSGQRAAVTLRLPGETDYRPGNNIALKIDWKRAKWFDAKGRVL